MSPRPRCYPASHSLLLFGALALVLAAPVVAQPIATVQNNGTALVFTPIGEFHLIVLTVTGPCDYQLRQVLRGADTGAFQLDETTIDGRYTYHLMREEAVADNIVAVLQEARANFDDETPKQLCRDGKLPPPPIAQSAGFRVLSGEIIFDNGEESAGPVSDSSSGPEITRLPSPQQVSRDFVILDDLIVDGSACIGFDCVNGESFGFDTIRLKEHNLRIKFDDTSTAASYPRTDWELVANDSANGGASRFSIRDVSGNRTPFTVEANARSHALYVDDGGRIGSRTSTPSVELHTIDGDTPTLRLQQDGSSGFQPQTWDVAGNETNFFVRDVTHGSQLPIRVRPDAPSNALFIDTDGSVGLGTSSPGARLEVKNGSVIVDGGFQASSSRTVKSDFRPVDRQALLESLGEMPIESWSYREGDSASRHLGPVAEEFHAAFGLGHSDRHIDLGDAAGVSLAGLQGILELLREKDRELARLSERLAAMEEALDNQPPAAARNLAW